MPGLHDCKQMRPSAGNRLYREQNHEIPAHMTKQLTVHNQKQSHCCVVQLRAIVQKKLTTSVEEDSSVSEHYNEVCKREARVRHFLCLLLPLLP